MDRQQYRDVMAAWPSGVTVVAARDEGRVIATTVTAFLSLSLDPPRVLFALGPNATVRPFLQGGRPCGVSLLGVEQRRLASIYADPFPVGVDPFDAGDAPVIPDALVCLRCTVSDVLDGGGHAIIVADVVSAESRSGAPLVRHAGRYTGIDGGST